MTNIPIGTYARAKRIAELEAQLKMVLDRESATHARHDAKVDKLEAKLAKAEYDPKCAKCGYPRSNHPYRHQFQALAELRDTTATRG